MAKVLIVDDEAPQRSIMRSILEAEQHVLFEADSVDAALKIVEDERPDIVLTDMKMPGKSGIELVEKIGGMALGPEVIVITAFGSVDTAVRAMRQGAYDYLNKPIDRDELVLVVQRAAEKRLLLLNSSFWREEARKKASEGLIAESDAMKQILAVVDKIADSDATVLLRGPSGTGKERVARMIHALGPRSGKPIQCINCAAFPESLLESELFGYEKGAFTGAAARKIGILESAEGSTLLLDEVADMSPATQAKILRSLQEREIRRLGGNDVIKIDVRFIAATNKNLEECVVQGTFREDLFYRLNVIPIVLPSLRDRPEDIRPLVEGVLARRGRRKHISADAMKTLQGYHWPGNVRELEALVERMAILSSGNVIMESELPPEIRIRVASNAEAHWQLPETGIVFEDLERSLLEQALQKSSGIMSDAAKLLGMTYRTFQYRAEKFKLT